MKIVVIADKNRYLKFMPDSDFVRSVDIVYVNRDTTAQELAAAASDAEVILADAISIVNAEMMDTMPMLKMIHSEGVAYNKIDIGAAAERGIYVCNNKGANSGAVAEQAIYLMLGLLRSAISGDRAVRDGRQIQMKEHLMLKGITELSECKVGIVGLGDIGLQTAIRLCAFGCEVCYYNRTRKPEYEDKFGLTYLPLEKLARTCDIVSLHLAVNGETTNIVDQDFLAMMKPTAYLINTARGELVDNMALRQALMEGSIAGAGLDTVAPEPVQIDNPLVTLPEDAAGKILFSPHLGGITTGTFRRCHAHMWANVERISKGRKPDQIVNM